MLALSTIKVLLILIMAVIFFAASAIFFFLGCGAASKSGDEGAENVRRQRGTHK